MKIYDKLVRDRIPEIIETSGKKCDIEVVSDEVALEYLYKKLNEEDVLNRRNEKKDARGGFENNIVLNITL